jgi:hypothetical protein
MKQIAEILKEKIKAEEKLAKKEERPVSGEVAKAAVLIQKVDPKYKTAAEKAAEKGKASPSTDCEFSEATPLLVKGAVRVVR